MRAALVIVNFLAFVAFMLLLGRALIDLLHALARSWEPRGVTAVLVESVYSATDPVVRWARRVLPTLKIRGAAVDLGLFVPLLVASFVLSATAGLVGT